ncbi:MAG TPA: DNA-formamidopyrimidine glycosylase [Bacilli bacterium]|nr:DNA-formamidopyrimidine glycosylase [Bacilli bacterium]
MPEIAEVETVRNTLKRQILNKKIKDVNILYDRIIECDLDLFKKALIGAKFINIDRKGKWLILELNNDYDLLSHLRMEGKFFLKSHNDPIVKHEHIIITFVDNTDLRYHDTRKFGRMLIVKKDTLNDAPCLKKLGYEPNSTNLTADYLLNKLKNKSITIKTLLLDQSIISGLGNIYANEVLFAAKINPFKKGQDISKKEAERIVKASNEIISKAIMMGGTTIKSYTSSLGVTGMFQQELKVHKRDKEKCCVCGSVIEKQKLNGRTVYYCPKCQK